MAQKLSNRPEINFRVDDTFEEAERINKLMHNPIVAADIAKNNEEEKSEE